LENEALRLQIIPQWGAKVHSLTHKATGAPLLLENPTHMPMNNGVRKPFASGGIEWNWGGGRGQIGHSVFSEEPAFVARVPNLEGDHVRVYEYDRFNGTLWQVDIHLPNDTSLAASRAAWFHVKVTNPNPNPLIDQLLPYMDSIPKIERSKVTISEPERRPCRCTRRLLRQSLHWEGELHASQPRQAIEAQLVALTGE